MSLAGAKRRYKILLREQDRLRERSATDQEIDRELERLRADYPELQEVKSSLSSATASMLAFAESMVEPEGGAAAASTPLMSGAQLHTSQHVVNDESCTKPAAAAASDLLPEPNVAPPAEVGNKRASSSLKSSRSDETTAATADDAGAHKALQLLTTFMLWVAPFVAPSRTTRGLCLLVMLSSIAIPVVHRTEPSIAAPCNSVRYYSSSSSSSPTSSSSHTALRHAYGVIFDG
ncbi:Hypothetical protein, putative [Bodo saltans]|uniref:Uncharacterized protein n=1 Tax=Bodo saltans TaxID=75058 RepID=A0A0S4JT66_BODSA|nr:Hypothetical protein, putative [Bodo saltans]|eukprot:CUG93175.1 Hypothetical protein, putative [Bodo saltans]